MGRLDPIQAGKKKKNGNQPDLYNYFFPLNADPYRTNDFSAPCIVRYTDYLSFHVYFINLKRGQNPPLHNLLQFFFFFPEHGLRSECLVQLGMRNDPLITIRKTAQ